MSEKIGEFLVRIGVMQPHQVEEVLQAQRASGAEETAKKSKKSV